jgi:hypothetical protein
MGRDPSASVELLLEVLERAYDRPSWHGPNLKSAIRRVEPAAAAWRPNPARHNIWEQVVHCAYWKYVVWRRLTGQKRGSFPLKGSNWFPRPHDAGAATWKSDTALLDEMHKQLHSAVTELSDKQLRQTTGRTKVSHSMLIAGAAAHDVYHAGQIQLLKRLASDAGM